MEFNFDAFLVGLNERLDFAKTADLFEQGQSSFFPMLQTQATWRYSRHGGKLHLHDGQHVYSFTMPENVEDEDFPSERLPDSNHDEFNKMPHKGIAQVHRADPGSIYVTLQDGAKNPTFTLQHQSDSQWKGIPKKKLKKLLASTEHSTTTQVEPQAMLEGAVKEASDILHSLDVLAGQGLQGLGQGAYNTVLQAGQDPAAAALKATGGYLGFKALSNLYHRRPMLEGAGTGLARPAATGLGLGMLSRNVFKVPGV